MEVGVHQAKSQLSALLRRVADGEEIVIKRGNEPVARLVPVAPTQPRELGMDAADLVVPDDFDDPLPDNVLDEFER